MWDNSVLILNLGFRVTYAFSKRDGCYCLHECAGKCLHFSFKSIRELLSYFGYTRQEKYIVV